jgi:hypothetical protein
MERIATLAAWESFYVIVGSSAAALTGLQFVVISVIGTDPDEMSTGTEEIGAFGTPTVVHFCVTLLVSAILSAPWHALGTARWAIGFCGVGGLLYTAAVVRRARAQKGYRPVVEDWIWHTVLPAIAYATLLAAGIAAKADGRSALFVIAGAALLLLFVGIHNAWDAVVYLAIARRKERAKEHR